MAAGATHGGPAIPMRPPRFTTTLAFRFIAPVTAACLIAAAGLYVSVMTTIERFSEDQMRYFVTEAKQQVSAVCDRAFDELQRSPLARDPREALVGNGGWAR